VRLCADDVRFIRAAFKREEGRAQPTAADVLMRRKAATRRIVRRRAFSHRYAIHFGVAPKTIRDVVNIRTWRTVLPTVVEEDDEEEALARSVSALCALDPFGVQWALFDPVGDAAEEEQGSR
jgi:hypothetical protein